MVLSAPSRASDALATRLFLGLHARWVVNGWSRWRQASQSDGFCQPIQKSMGTSSPALGAGIDGTSFFDASARRAVPFVSRVYALTAHAFLVIFFLIMPASRICWCPTSIGSCARLNVISSCSAATVALSR